MKYINSIIKLILISGFVTLYNGCNNTGKTIEIDFNGEVSKLNDSLTGEKILYVAVSSMISPKETFHYYVDLINYISKKIGIKILLKQRKTYKEVNEMLVANQVDFAFICSGAYVDERSKFDLLAVPVTNGKPFYQSYIIVNESSGIKQFNELKGKSFAFTDPLSNSGKLYAVKRLNDLGFKPETFFSRIINTYAHDYSIYLVSKGTVDGASIDGLIYEYLLKNYPERVENILVIEKSQDFGIPPIVCSKELPGELKNKIKTAFFELNNDSTGIKIIEKLLIEKFTEGNEKDYLEIENMKKYVSQ